MSDGGGNYSFYNHNLRRPTIQPNRLLTRQSSSENELNNFGRLSILSPTVKTDEPQFAGEPLVSSYVPHPPSSPRSKRATPIRFRAKKRSRHESPRTSGSEDEKFSRKQLAVSSSLQPIRSSSTGSLDGFSSDPEFHRRRHFRGLEPLNITSRKDLVETFKIHQHGSKNQSLAHPMKVKRDINGNGDDRTVKNHENAIDNDKNTINNVKNEKLDKISHATNITNSEQNCNIGEKVITENDLKESNNSIDNNECTTSKTTTESERTISLSDDDSFTNVSQSDDDNTLSSSSDSDDELKKKSEEIAEALTSRRYLNATLPSIPKGSNHSNNTTHYESMNANKPAELSNTYESVSGFEKVLNETNKDSETYLSDADFRRGDSEFSYGSQVSLLPRVPARTVKLRSTNFLEEEMEKYFPDKKVSVFVATWNMHEEKCIPEYLDEFLMPENVDFLPDMYVIGLQESTPLRKEWEIKLQETLGPSHVLMYSTTFGVLHMAVYIRRELVWFCSAVNQNSVATRPGHMIKTKGGLAVSFSLFGTSFLFINSHLTSDEGKFKDRVNDYNIIRKSLTLQTVEKLWTDNRPDVTDRFDRVFWLGDFNFRVNLKREKVDELLTQYKEQNTQDLKEMRTSDQLTNLMEKGEVFCGFTEPDVTFLPTYKYDLNSDVYDTSSKARVPSWTDRILFKSTEESSIISTCYDACSSVTISDHRPVYGIYEVTLKPCKKSVPLTGGQFVRDVYIEANRRRNTVNNRNQQDSSVCTIL